MDTEVWIIHKRRVVLLTTRRGVPVEVITHSDGTIGGTVFPANVHVGSFLFDEQERAEKVAIRTARRLGYSVEYEDNDDNDDEAVEAERMWRNER